MGATGHVSDVRRALADFWEVATPTTILELLDRLAELENELERVASEAYAESRLGIDDPYAAWGKP